MGKTFSDEFVAKASINNLDPEHLANYKNGKGISLHAVAMDFADAIIKGSPDFGDTNEKLLVDLKKPVLEFLSEEEYLPAYLEFYNSLLEQEVE